MNAIINFVIRNKVALLFLILFGISLSLTIQSHSFHKSKFINSANFFTGGIYDTASGIGDYFDLRKENDLLQEENNRLRTIIYNSVSSRDSSYIDTIYAGGRYKFTPAQVIKNNFSQRNNYLTINRGERDSIKSDFGVITSNGIIGIIENTSRSYASVISVLNPKIQINARLNNSNHIGSLVWNGDSPYIVQLKDISKFAEPKRGDTISTGGQSSIFPKGIPIGSIQDFKLDVGGDNYVISVKLFNDMTNIGHVYIIENLDKAEIKSLEKPIDD